MKPDLKVLTPEDAPKPPQDEKQSPAQSEMPFAVVDGEPVTTLPQDLYIPPYALQVFLEAFEGPLDLLLYLIRRQNIDVLDIPIAEITKQYVQYIDLMDELQLELAGEYLLMAAMLAEIKSRMLLPRPQTEDEDDEADPRAELVRRLQEYERFKKAAQDLSDLPRLDRDTFLVNAEAPERKVVTNCRTLRSKNCCSRFMTFSSARRCTPICIWSVSHCPCANACQRFSRESRSTTLPGLQTCLIPKKAVWELL